MAKNNMQDMMDSTDMIDTGHEVGGPALPASPLDSPAPKKKMAYPCIHLELDSEVKFPAGDFSFVGVGRLDRLSADQPDPEDPQDKPCFCYDVQVKAIHPVGPVSPKEKASENVEPLDSADVLELKIKSAKK